MRKKILLADDSITIQKVIELTFSDEDFDVVTVGNGRLAVERIEDIRPDIVLCDIIMPEKDGYEVCEYIKKHPRLSSTPVLLLTGAFEPFDQERAARVGCDGFLAKPFEPASLIGKVNELLAHATSMATEPPAAAAPEPVLAAPEASIAEPFVEASATEPTMSFIPEEPLVPEEPILAEEPIIEEMAAITFGQTEDVELPPSAEVAEQPSVLEQEFYGVGEEIESAPDDYVPVSPEEAQTLSSTPVGNDLSATMVFQAEGAPWAQPPLEPPAGDFFQRDAAAAAADVDVPAFEEVFDEEIGVPDASVPREIETPPGFFSDASAFEEPAAPAEAPATFDPRSEFGQLDERAQPVEAASAFSTELPAFEEHAAAAVDTALRPAPGAFEPSLLSRHEPPPPDVELGESSFADILPPVEPEAQAAVPEPSEAGQVSVPVEMVAQIAQRVVAQISERVVREVAWEVIPDLAEALIRKEIERLKAELQQT